MTAACDVAILGAGPDGLAAATVLARAGLKCVVIEGAEKPGGIAATREFHPGFRASPWADELAAIPAALHWSFDLTRRGTIFVPAAQSLALWPDRRHVLDAFSADAAVVTEKAAAMREQILAHEQPPASRRWPGLFGNKIERKPWPGESWSTKSLHEILAGQLWDESAAAHLAALALCGRSADPFVKGSALHLLAPGAGDSGLVMGGLARLSEALVRAATDAGADIRCGLDAGDVELERNGVTGIVLADGTDIEARAVISTLDAKRTFLSLFHWQTLPDSLAEKAGAFRVAGSTARVLFALSGLPPALPPDALRGPICVAPDMEQSADACLAWRARRIADALPVVLRFPSLLDPGLAPIGAAVMTATLGAVPARLFDGGWTRERRDLLRDRALASAESVLPGLASRVVASETITPNDIEAAIGATDGDLWGGEIAADQMFGFRPWPEPAAPRTPVGNLYLGGASSAFAPFATCVAGVRAARAVLADLKRGDAT